MQARQAAHWSGTLALILLVFAPAAATQAASQEPSGRVSDPRGDVVVQVGSARYPAPAGLEHLDILAAWIGNETTDAFEVGLSVAAWRPPSNNVEREFSAFYRTQFQFQDNMYQVAFSFFPGCPQGQFSLHMANVGPNSGGAGRRWAHAACLETVSENAGLVHRVLVPKDLIVNRDGAPARYGTVLEGFYAEAEVWFVGGPRAFDLAPDAGGGTTFQFQHGSQAIDHIQISSPSPIRFSNGESTTIVYEVHLDNLGEQDDSYALDVEDLEEGWSARVPALVRVPGGETVVVPLVLSMGFTHRHGETATFRLTATSARDGGVTANAILGVHWPAVPQPAGHHDTLYLHSQLERARVLDPVMGEIRTGWFNALEKDPDPTADDREMATNDYSRVGTGNRFSWWFELRPALRMGLDFDIEREGRLQASVYSLEPDGQMVLGVQLWLCEPELSNGSFPGQHGCPQGSWFLLASGRSAPRAVAANSQVPFDAPVAATELADLIPYRRGKTLLLQVYADTQSSAFAPNGLRLVVAGSRLALPLVEYHDPVEQSFLKVGSLSIATLGPASKEVNRGKVVAFPLEIRNEGNGTLRARFLLEGYNVEWARWSASGSDRISPGGVVHRTIFAEAPMDAGVGERSEIFAVVEAIGAPEITALARLRASVVSHDVPDERAYTLEATAGTPGVAAAWMFALVAALAGLRRASGRVR